MSDNHSAPANPPWNSPSEPSRAFTYAGTLIGPLGDTIEIAGKVWGTKFRSPYDVAAAVYRTLTGKALRARRSAWQVWGGPKGHPSGWLQTNNSDPILRVRFWAEGANAPDNTQPLPSGESLLSNQIKSLETF